MARWAACKLRDFPLDERQAAARQSPRWRGLRKLARVLLWDRGVSGKAGLASSQSKENAMTRTTTNLNELIEVLNDGITFYDDAVNATENAGYRALFMRMAASKRAIVADLGQHVSRLGDTPADGGTVMGALRKGYADLRASLSKHPDARYIAQLEECEDRILEAFRDALAVSDDAALRAIAQQHLPQVRAMHDQMRALKRDVERAA